MSRLISNITGVVMAGGKSQRMGTDKGLMDFKGKPMAQYSIDVLQSVFEKVAISSNNPDYTRFGIPVFGDEYFDCGPICGLHATLKYIDTEYVFILSCDTPYVDKETVLLLLTHLASNSIVVPEVEGKLEPLCGLYSKMLLPEIETRIAEENFKLYHFIRNHEDKKLVQVDANKFININSPDDLSTIA